MRRPDGRVITSFFEATNVVRHFRQGRVDGRLSVCRTKLLNNYVWTARVRGIRSAADKGITLKKGKGIRILLEICTLREPKNIQQQRSLTGQNGHTT